MTRTEALKLALQYANYIPKDKSLFDFADMIEAYPRQANKLLKVSEKEENKKKRVKEFDPWETHLKR